ncbi:MAG: response regulator [bacterium]
MPEHSVKILVVDDDIQLLELLVDTLSAIGYDVAGAGDGAEALGKLKEGHFDLLVTDIKMPGIDGISLLKKCRRYYPSLPVLFITGFASPEVIGHASPDGFLVKPFRISHIEQLIDKALSGSDTTTRDPLKKILIVDDDDLFRAVLSDSLRAHDYQPLSAASAEQGLKEIRYGEVDAVIADICMPGMNGAELLRQVKQNSPEVPVILMTGNLQLPEMPSSDIAAADGFLNKPFRIENMIQMLDDLAVRPGP